MKYFIDGEQVSEGEFNNRLEGAVEVEVEDNYDDTLDDCYDTFKIGYLEFYASEILKKCDPIAYRCGMSDEVSYRLEEYQSEFENGAFETINGSDYETQEDDEEEND